MKAQQALRLAVCCLGLAACSAQARQLAPLGEVVISVDTDAPVPLLVNRLRIDVFDEKGNWFDTHDVLRTDPRDWPTSFSVYSEDMAHTKTVIVRIRGYLEGQVRGYVGEQFREPARFVEPSVASTLPELCEQPAQLRLSQDLTLRTGSAAPTSFLPTEDTEHNGYYCPEFSQGGVGAASLHISDAGAYRIAVTRTLPVGESAADTVLYLRKECAVSSSQIACDDDVPTTSGVGNARSALQLHLDPGSYTVLAEAYGTAPIDITVRADPVLDDGTVATPVEPMVDTRDVKPLISDASGLPTPESEPMPLSAIDRLLRVEIAPGKKQLTSVMLRGQCSGTMARLSKAGSFADLVPSEAETCVDTERVRVPVPTAALIPYQTPPTRAHLGEFGINEPCAADDAQSAAVCIPGGAFMMGPADASIEQRFALLHHFWLDRTEVTVERWRAAVARGFVPQDTTPMVNNGPLDSTPSGEFLTGCTYSSAPLPGANQREQYPVVCLTWYDARGFCQFEGGDLPSEAQWEYASGVAGRATKSRFPWPSDNSGPSCDQAVFGRQPVAVDHSDECAEKGLGLQPVDSAANQHDRTPLGVRSMGGNASEWLLDSWTPDLESRCWQNATLVDPLCWEQSAVARSVRGGSEAASAYAMVTTVRSGLGPTGLTGRGWTNIGFRCAYPEAP